MKNLLVTTDFSEGSLSAFDAAQEQVKLYGGNNVIIHVLAVLENFSLTNLHFEFGMTRLVTESFRDKVYQESRQRVRALCDAHLPGCRVRPAVVRGTKSAAEEIVQFSGAEEIDTILIASHGRSGIRRRIIGGVTERVLRKSTCPVIVVPAKGRVKESTVGPPSLRRHVMILTDLSELSTAAFSFAREQAGSTSVPSSPAQVTLLYFCENLTRATYHFDLGSDAEMIWREMESQALDELNRHRENYFAGMLVDTVVQRVYKALHEEILDYARTHHADLIVLTSHGESGYDQAVLGSVAGKLARLAMRPVMIVPVRE